MKYPSHSRWLRLAIVRFSRVVHTVADVLRAPRTAAGGEDSVDAAQVERAAAHAPSV
jgi:hypothetical protein